jgi:hypothetical protein
MKGINSTGAPLVHVPGVGGWVDGWTDGWVGGCKSHFKDCLQQSKTQFLKVCNVGWVLALIKHKELNQYIF